MEKIILDVLYIPRLEKNLPSTKQPDKARREFNIKLGHIIEKCKLCNDLYE